MGNKSDLQAERVISQSEIDLFVNLNEMEYLEVSAKTGQNVSECFFRAATIVVEAIEKKSVEVDKVF